MRLLIINTDSVKKPLTGGQKRTNAIYKYYKKLGHDVIFIGVYKKANLAPGRTAGEHDIFLHKSAKDGSYILAANAIINDTNAYRKLVNKVKSFQPDAVQIENPFLLPLIEKLEKDGQLSGHTKLIYSSHNIEQKLVQTMPDVSQVINNKSAKQYVKLLEKNTILRSDLIIACTKSDAEEFKHMGGKKVILAKNGIAPILYNSQQTLNLKKEYKSKGFHRTILYISSPHPPNTKGFIDMVGTKLGFLGFNTRIILAGGVSSAVSGYVEEQCDVVEKSCFYQRYAGFGIVSEEKLAAIIDLADIMILPVTSGGGSNLKTAEALQSKKPIIATSTAMRDYEQFIDLPNVYIEDNPDSFQNKMAELAKNIPKYSFTNDQIKLINSVLWENTLQSLKKIGTILNV